ncbi:MAG: VWA domain-containing protein [Candidatus Omnitrophica bacterium]|nr:VWA domain-containing protein [Candidatus Omnitrophota bacterium]
MSGKRKIVMLAVCLSLAAHGVFFASSRYIILSGMSDTLDRSNRLFRLRTVRQEPASVDLLDKKKETPPPVSMFGDTPDAETIVFKEILPEEKRSEDLPMQSKKNELDEQRFEELLSDDIEPFDPSEALRKETERAMEKAAPVKRSFFDGAGESMMPRVKVFTVPEGGEDGFTVPGRIADVPSGPSAEVSGFTGTEAFMAGTKELSSLYGKTQVGEYQDIGSFLDVGLSVYRDPDTGEKFFRLSVNVEEKGPLDVIPKDIVYLIDSSKSMTEQKLFYVRDGVIGSLGKMNPGDRFNVVAFRGDVTSFRKGPVPATARNIEEAASFVEALEAKGQTDVENALLDIIGTPPEREPSYIVLVTDGRPTTGLMDSRRINQEITRRNMMKRPIFCFGGGYRVNKYLLDFLSYQNRAWSSFSDTAYEMKEDFREFYREIKDPLLINVRYRFSGVDDSEVYPRFLPDLFRRKTFSLYGKFDREDMFSVQLLGEENGDLKEFIFRGDLKDGKKGGKEIAQEWAFRKIYYLISRITMGEGDKRELMRRIEELSRRYGITTPYDMEDNDQ